jgi:hypothetical protein
MAYGYSVSDFISGIDVLRDYTDTPAKYRRANSSPPLRRIVKKQFVSIRD